MSLAALAGSSEVHACVWMLLHFVWQGSLIAGALRCVLFSLPRYNASARYASCSVALLLMALSPPATLWLLLAAERRGVVGGALSNPDAAAPAAYLSLALLGAWLVGSAAMTA